MKCQVEQAKGLLVYDESAPWYVLAPGFVATSSGCPSPAHFRVRMKMDRALFRIARQWEIIYCAPKCIVEADFIEDVDVHALAERLQRMIEKGL